MVDPPGSFDAPTSAADLAALAEAKETLRTAVRSVRAGLTAHVRAERDAARTTLVLNFLSGRVGPGLTVAAYLSRADEPGTLELVAALHASGVRVLLPVLGPLPDGSRREQPDWARYAGPDQLRLGRHNIIEPTTPALGPQAIAEAEVIICPGLGATRTGDRLGMGAGWYDRALLAARPEAVTVVFVDDHEVFEVLPVAPWDRPMDVVATPNELISAVVRPPNGLDD